MVLGAHLYLKATETERDWFGIEEAEVKDRMGREASSSVWIKSSKPEQILLYNVKRI